MESPVLVPLWNLLTVLPTSAVRRTACGGRGRTGGIVNLTKEHVVMEHLKG